MMKEIKMVKYMKNQKEMVQYMANDVKEYGMIGLDTEKETEIIMERYREQNFRDNFSMFIDSSIKLAEYDRSWGRRDPEKQKEVSDRIDVYIQQAEYFRKEIAGDNMNNDKNNDFMENFSRFIIFSLGLAEIAGLWLDPEKNKEACDKLNDYKEQAKYFRQKITLDNNN